MKKPQLTEIHDALSTEHMVILACKRCFDVAFLLDCF